MDPWLVGIRAWASRKRIPGTGPQEAGLLHLGVEGLGSIFSPPLPILPLRDSCMGEWGTQEAIILGLAHTPGLLGIQL